MLICNAVLTDADGARPGDVRIENGVYVGFDVNGAETAEATATEAAAE